MFLYEKKLQYPVRITRTNPKLASFIISQYGGPDGELGASLRYLSQRYAMPYPELKGLLTDIGTEELGHLEMIGASTYPQPDRKTDLRQRFCSLFCGSYYRNLSYCSVWRALECCRDWSKGRRNCRFDGRYGSRAKSTRDI